MLFFHNPKYCNQKNHYSSPDSISHAAEKRAPHATSYIRASLTLEASLVLPLFLAAIISLIYVIQVIQIKINMQKALYHQAMAVCGYSYYTELIDAPDVAEKLVQAAYIKNKIIKELGTDYLDDSYIVNGSKGVKLSSNLTSDGKYLDVTLKYKTKAFFDLLGVSEISVTSKVKCRLWTGEEEETDSGESSEYAFVTANGTVYHTSENCTYLKSELSSCSVSEIANVRNESGGKYYACSACEKDNYTGKVYYTKYGTRYHTTLLCRNIHSNVYTISLDLAKEKYSLCSKCKKESENSG